MNDEFVKIEFIKCLVFSILFEYYADRKKVVFPTFYEITKLVGRYINAKSGKKIDQAPAFEAGRHHRHCCAGRSV